MKKRMKVKTENIKNQCIMRKYMILTAIAALALTACAKIDSGGGGGVQKKDVPIGFTNYTPTPLSKVGDTYVDGTALVSGKQFAVYAWLTDYGSFLPVNPGAPTFMNPAVVTWSEDADDGSGNTYTPTRYWPSGDNPANLSFTAYYPYEDGNGITPPTFGSGNPFVASGVGTYAFAAAATPAAMVDFCVADVVNDQTYGNTNKTASGHKGTVNFSFHHQLTKVQFKFKKSSGLQNTTVVELVDAELSGIKNSGTLTATFARHMDTTDPDIPVEDPGVNKLGTTSTAWSGQSGSAGYEITLNQADPESGSEIVLTESASTVHKDDVFLMVPQDMAASTQALTITWKVKVYDNETNATANNGTGLASETTNTKTLYFYSDLVMDTYDHDGNPDTPQIPYPKNWIKNNAVIYTITIGPNPIYFTGTASSWNGETTGYFNVN
jgi:hypothetical protein